MVNYSLKNLTKPVLIMISAYMLVHMIAFFIQHKERRPDLIVGLQSNHAGSEKYIGDVSYVPEIIPLKEKKKTKPGMPEARDTVADVRISPSGELIP